MMQKALISATIEKSRLVGVTEMTHERVGDMSMRELTQLTNAAVDQRLHTDESKPYRQKSNRPFSAVIESIKQNMIIPKPGTPSLADVIREDRDQ
jgi:hypothetical protein